LSRFAAASAAAIHEHHVAGRSIVVARNGKIIEVPPPKPSR
jgi:hypothetical protein